MSTLAPSFPPPRGLALRANVVVFDQNIVLLDYIREELGNSYNIRLLSERSSLLRELRSEAIPDIILFSWDGAGRSLPMLREILAIAGDVPILLLACSPDNHEMRLVMNMGVRDVMLKPFDQNDLKQVIEKHLKTPEQPIESSVRVVNRQDIEVPLGDDRYFVRSSAAMRAVETEAKLIAASDIPVLVLGESGTGKEVLALFLHKMSMRSKEMFLKVNCAAMPADLLESELFGYEQGAFTGAMKAKPGKFELCNGGTIFLDEIGEMPAPLQAKLLHVLQDGTFSRLGGKTTIKVNVRVIAATNINIRESIAAKTFREDLYYRLNGFSLRLPALRERTEEIPILAEYFMRRAAAKYNRTPITFTRRMISAMQQYHWPGNLRELENVISRYLILADEASILRELEPQAPERSPAPSNTTPSIKPMLPEPTPGEGLKSIVKSLKGDAEAMAILSALQETRWNRKAAARNLKISYKALLYKIKNYNLDSAN